MESIDSVFLQNVFTFNVKHIVERKIDDMFYDVGIIFESTEKKEIKEEIYRLFEEHIMFVRNGGQRKKFICLEYILFRILERNNDNRRLQIKNFSARENRKYGRHFDRLVDRMERDSLIKGIPI